MTNAELMNEEEKFLTAPQLEMLELIESVWMNNKKNNTLSIKAGVLAGRLAIKAPTISKRLKELCEALATSKFTPLTKSEPDDLVDNALDESERI